MKDAQKAGLKRLERLVQIKQTYVSVAEANVKTAETEVRQLETAEQEITGNIQHTQEGIAYLQTATGQEVQSGENYIKALELHRKAVRLSLEKATNNLEQRRTEWTEAMREQTIVEKLQERRLHQCVRDDEVANQKSQDEMSVGRYARIRQKPEVKEIARTKRSDTENR
jgi:flagellar export protein FliJ